MDEALIPANLINTYSRYRIKGYDLLERLALNLRWSWMHDSDKIWKELDAVLWDLTRNPWVVLQTVSKEKLEKLLSDPIFHKNILDQIHVIDQELKTPGWFYQKYATAPLKHIAYFSMEYMLTEALPIYSGGLGNVAGDQLKAASDLDVPVTAIGLLYQKGYFRQIIDKDGVQQALYPYNDPGQLPITPLRKENGEWLRLEVVLPGYSLWLRAWQVRVGKVKLYLLDSNDAANFPAYRGITSELYGGSSETRLKQELILGIGGWRLLETLGIKPEVCHLNEGHAAFAILERAHSFMKDNGVDFEVALAATRPGNLFTTHTAVPAGFDRFSPSLLQQFMEKYISSVLGITLDRFLALGRQNPNDANEQFNMAYLAARGSGAINGVSRLHGEVSRTIFGALYPGWPISEIPIGYVTNGVHMPSWDSAPADKLWEESCGKCRWLDETEKLEKSIKALSDVKLWEMRNKGRKNLVLFTRDRYTRQLEARGASPEDVELARRIFDPNVLTLGFARRFATYKRPDLLLYDKDRLLRILTNTQQPVQLLIAGKAHPADIPGQKLILEWSDFISRPEVKPHVVFLSDYDILLCEELVRGVDVWINTPRRPWEACGTSGMKILVNGGLNLSELDGWWAEAYRPEVGWALGDGNEHMDLEAWDAAEARALYEVLETAVIPEFYNRDIPGMSSSWIAKIRESMATLTPYYSSNRTVRQYTEQYYLPAARGYLERAKDKGLNAIKLVQEYRTILDKWPKVHFGELKVTSVEGNQRFEVQVFLKELSPRDVKVELFANGVNGSLPEIAEMKLESKESAEGMATYAVTVTDEKPSSDYTPRIVLNKGSMLVPLEAHQVLWQK